MVSSSGHHFRDGLTGSQQHLQVCYCIHGMSTHSTCRCITAHTVQACTAPAGMSLHTLYERAQPLQVRHCTHCLSTHSPCRCVTAHVVQVRTAPAGTSLHTQYMHAVAQCILQVKHVFICCLFLFGHLVPVSNPYVTNGWGRSTLNSPPPTPGWGCHPCSSVSYLTCFTDCPTCSSPSQLPAGEEKLRVWCAGPLG